MRGRCTPESISAAMRSASRPRSAADLEHRLAGELGLGRKRASWYSQKLALGRRCLAGLGGQRRQRVALGDRQVAEGEDEAVAEALADPAQHRLGAEAEGALEVAEHDQLQRPAQLAADVIDALQRRVRVVRPRTRCYVLVHNVESILILLLAAALLVRLAEFGNIPAPIVLVLGGLAIAFVPGPADVELDPDVVFLVFLPPLVYAAGWRTSPLELRALMRPLALLSVGLVFLTAAVVAVVAHALVPELGWAEAAVLGAVLAPTDAVSATSIFRRLGAPERVRLLVEGESMINDGTALVLYRIAIGVATGGAFSFGGAALEFIGVSVGGIAVGLAVGALSDLVIRRQTDAGLVDRPLRPHRLRRLRRRRAARTSPASSPPSSPASTAATSRRARSTPTSASAPSPSGTSSSSASRSPSSCCSACSCRGSSTPSNQTSSGVSELLAPVAAIAAASIAVRLAFVFAMGSDAGETAGQRFAVGWSGMRGAVSLAAALAVPLSVDARPQIIFLTFALILVTLVGQGLSLPFIVRALRLEEPRRWSDEEAVARMEAAQSALDRLDEIEERGTGRRAPAEAAARPLPRAASGCARPCSAARTPRPPPASSASPTTASCAAS